MRGVRHSLPPESETKRIVIQIPKPGFGARSLSPEGGIEPIAERPLRNQILSIADVRRNLVVNIKKPNNGLQLSPYLQPQSTKNNNLPLLNLQQDARGEVLRVPQSAIKRRENLGAIYLGNA